MRAPGFLLQEHLGQQTDQVVALDERAVLVEEEAAVEVAVPGEADVGAAACAWPSMVLVRFSSIIGLGTPLGNEPSGSWWTLMNSNGRCGSSRSITMPAPPLPALTTTFRRRSLLRST